MKIVVETSRRFPLVGEPAALDLVNTLVRRGSPLETDLIATPSDLAEWLAVRGSASTDDLSRVHQLRACLIELIDARLHGTTPRAGAVAFLNEVSKSCPPEIAWETAPTLVTGGFIAEAVTSGFALLTSPDGTIRKCAHPECTLLFAATNPRRQWCSASGCGNRARAMRHYQRRQPS